MHQKKLPDAFPITEEYSSFAFLISITFSSRIANKRPESPTANFQGKVKPIICEIDFGNEDLLFRYLKAFLIVPGVGKATVSFLL